MFRVKINLNAIRHDIKSTEAGAQKRLGDWAEEMAKPHPQLSKEDLCETFRDKFHEGHAAKKNIA